MVRPEDLAATLLARRRADSAAALARRDHARAQVERVVGRFKAEGRITRAWLIGSVLSPSFGERSDVDLVVEGASPIELEQLADAIADACSVAIDLLVLETLPASFRARVLREGVAIDVT